MAEEKNEVVTRLEEVLEKAKKGEIDSLAYVYSDPSNTITWGHIGVTDYGLLLYGARISAMALEEGD
ncbi:hypothetical protein J7400_18895 [Shimia sp. R9_2]|uniref:hypothetical protein n=1 Tax=Shimia sp. R9_2 TaxID=2821112 RepID=UPI001AD9DAA7|nr:hypothetical protein [Shimia sp. R9_2]MBO9398745.1 hypothetical protein [Shimia sp. R9_2]